MATYLKHYCVYVMQKEHVILSQSGVLLALTPELRQQVLAYTRFGPSTNKAPQQEDTNTKFRIELNPSKCEIEYKTTEQTKLLEKIFSYLDYKTLLVVQLVCNKWRFLSDQTSWKQLVLSHWSVMSEKDHQKIASWKHYYMFKKRQEMERARFTGITDPIMCTRKKGGRKLSFSFFQKKDSRLPQFLNSID